MSLAMDAPLPVGRCSVRAVAAAARPLPQQRLYFNPEPQAQRELRLGSDWSVGFCRIMSD